jgi:hypothetical protein
MIDNVSLAFCVGHWSEYQRNVLLEVFPVDTTAQISALFREINCAEPVRLVDLQLSHEYDVESADQEQLQLAPVANSSVSTEKTAQRATKPVPVKAASPVKPQDQKAELSPFPAAAAATTAAPTPAAAKPLQGEQLLAVLNEASDRLQQQFPDMFKPSSRCKPPHLNIDVLRDDLFQSEFAARHAVASAEDLVRLLLRANAAAEGALIKKQQQQDPAASSSPLGPAAIAAQKKAKEFGLFLGLDKAWLYQQHC